MKKENKGSTAKDGPMVIGERIEFDRVLKSHVDTRFGAATVVKFVKDREIKRSLFAGKGLLDWLDENKTAKQVTLVDKIADGEITYNIYE